MLLHIFQVTDADCYLPFSYLRVISVFRVINDNEIAQIMFTSRVSFLLPLLYVPFLFIYFFYIFLNLHKFVRSTDVRPATDPPSSRIPPVWNWSTFTGRPQMKALVICFLLSPRLLRNFPCRFAFRAFVRDHGAERSGKKERKKGKNCLYANVDTRRGERWMR